MRIKIASAKATVYPILVDSGLFKQVATWLPQDLRCHQIVIVTDHTVRKLYVDSLIQDLQAQNINTLLISIPVGEKSKTYATKQYIEEKMLQHRCDRNTLLLAVGGGVIGDVAGFVAATYMRGIAYIQVPTTLLAMVDSSVGGKTGINTAYGKNLIGAFWQPKAVVADVNCLNTLPKKQIINGLIEALKIFVTNDKRSLEYARKHVEKIMAYDPAVLKEIISRSIKIKAAIVVQDEKEENQRRVLNFGHTIGHALEQISQYKILHGYAVALGMLVEAKISQHLGLLEPKAYLMVQEVLFMLGISGKALKKFSIDEIIQATHLDKKTKAGEVHYVLLSAIGKVHSDHQNFTYPVADKIVKQALQDTIEG